MKKVKINSKKIAVSKSSTQTMIIVGVATFIAVFCLVASKTMVLHGRYQSKVISQKETTLKQLKSNVDSAKKLDTAYQEFNGSRQNMLGGDPNGNGDRDGQNSRIVLDALPSKYDFPALATSLEKMLKDNSFLIGSFTGIDDEITQAQKSSESNPQPVEIPFTFEASASPDSASLLVGLLERSIRPIQVQKLVVSKQNSNLTLTIDAKTFFQPGKNADVRQEVVN